MATQQVQDDLLRKSYPLFEDNLVTEIEEQGEFKTFPANEILMRKGSVYPQYHAGIEWPHQNLS